MQFACPAIHARTQTAIVTVSNCSVAFHFINTCDGFPGPDFFGGRFLELGYLCRLRADRGRLARALIFDSDECGRPPRSTPQLIPA